MPTTLIFFINYCATLCVFSRTGGGFEEDDDADSHYSRDSRSLDTTDEAPNLANNVRIKSKRFLRDYEVEDDVGECCNMRVAGLRAAHSFTCVF